MEDKNIENQNPLVLYFEKIDKFCATAVNTGKIVLSDFIYL